MRATTILKRAVAGARVRSPACRECLAHPIVPRHRQAYKTTDTDREARVMAIRSLAVCSAHRALGSLPKENRMKHLALFAASLVAALSVPGCATRDFGRQSSLTDYEREAMSCQDIDQEMNRIVAFVKRVNSPGEQHGIELVATLENRWIGNGLERGAALESANNRMIQLWTLRDSKKCSVPASAEAQSFPLQKPAVEERF